MSDLASTSKHNSDRTPYPWQNVFDKTRIFPQYFVMTSTRDSDLRLLNVFKVNKEVNVLLGGPVKKISHGSDGSLHITVTTEDQSVKILTIESFLGEPVAVARHRTYNSCQGVITSSLLKDYSEEDILDGLKDQKVVKVYRFKRTVEGNLVNTNSLVLTFDTAVLPERIEILCGSYERIRPYYPLPRRCFTCQKFGHVGKFCKARGPVCGTCGGPHPS